MTITTEYIDKRLKEIAAISGKAPMVYGFCIQGQENTCWTLGSDLFYDKESFDVVVDKHIERMLALKTNEVEQLEYDLERITSRLKELKGG